MTVENFRSPFRGASRFVAISALAIGLGAALPGPAAFAAEAAAAPQAMPVSVARVEEREAMIWHEFSGRLEAVDRVEIRSRVVGAVQAVHFREGSLVKTGDLLITIDPAPYAAEVAKAKAQVAAAQAAAVLAKADLDRAKKLSGSPALSERDLDQRLNASREADANLQGAQAALQAAQLNLDYTQIRAPVAGRVGRLEVTVGNLVAAGPSAPVLTSLVSVDPIYASFDADEPVAAQALKGLSPQAVAQMQVDRIPVRLRTDEGTEIKGRLQLINNQVDTASGTVRMRAVFDNDDGHLMPGQFVRLSMGEAKPKPALLVSERAIGTDQDKKFVFVVDDANKAAYREVTLGAFSNGLRIIKTGVQAGERVVVNGLQRVRPGVVVAPQMVSMDGASADAKSGRPSAVAQR